MNEASIAGVANTALLSPSSPPSDMSRDEVCAVSVEDVLQSVPRIEPVAQSVPRIEPVAVQVWERIQFPAPEDGIAATNSVPQMGRILSLQGETQVYSMELSTASKMDLTEVRAAGRKTANRKRSSHVTKLCFLVVLVFGLSWLPLQLYLLMAYCGFKPQNKWYQAYRPLCHVLAYSNASVNPIIYHYVSRDFRQSLGRMATKFRAWWRHGN